MKATSLHEAIKCLPARTSQQISEGAGHWLAAFTKAEEQKYKNLHQRSKTCRKCQNNRGAECRTLDGAFLLELHCVDKPSDLCSVHISELNLKSVKPEELREFHNVVFIDASVNSLSLDSFSNFLSLREINLSLNGLKHMQFCAAVFPHLQVLDLSYNSLSAGSVASIGRLPRLKVLHLTGNALQRLPPDMGVSSRDATQLRSSEEEHAAFPALEVLQLDDNRLTSGVFWSVKNLKRLKTLNLQGNCISEIPYLLLRGSIKPSIDEYEYVFKERNPDERMRRLSQMCRKANWEEGWMHCGPSLPLPELQVLNLADNKIKQEEALLAVALFPALRELDICSNPVTTQRIREPPSLTQCLQHRLGITVKRKPQPVTKLPLRLSGPEWKDAPRPPRADGSHASIKRKPKSSNNKGRECFLLTKVTDIPEAEVNLQAKERIPAEGKTKDDISVILRDCEMLMDAKPIPNVGIQAAIRMLEHKLRNLAVYKDSKPKVDYIPKPHRRREKRVVFNAEALPPIKPRKQRDQRVEDMPKEIPSTRVPSSSVIRSTGVSRQEALLLLRDMETKYKTLHRKTMEEAGRLWEQSWETLSVSDVVCSAATPGC